MNYYPYPSVSDVTRTLASLEQIKSKAYGNSWRKHGELVSIFANISRKYDRLENILFKDGKVTPDENLMDTVADLAVYCGLYVTWLFEQPGMPGGPVTFWLVMESVERRFRYNDQDVQTRYWSRSACANAWKAFYTELEDVLVNNRHVELEPGKVGGITGYKMRLAIELCSAAVSWLVLAKRDEPAAYAEWARPWKEVVYAD